MSGTPSNNGMAARNNVVWNILYATIALPAVLFILNFNLSSVWLARLGLSFISRVAELTAFPVRANLFLFFTLAVMPLQAALIFWMTRKTDVSRFDAVTEMLRENGPLIRLGRLVLVRKRLGFGLGSMVGYIFIFISIFFVGGDLFLCKGCETTSPFLFLAINSVGSFAMMMLMVVFAVWLKLLPRTRR